MAAKKKRSDRAMAGTLLEIVSWIALVAGGAFFLIGAIGLKRMPDVFTRMHAVSVSETLGVGLMTLGMVAQSPDLITAAKLIMILLVLWMTGPVATHALARAALHDELNPLIRDKSGKLLETAPDKAERAFAQSLKRPAGRAKSKN